jgi:hypothetical protein
LNSSIKFEIGVSSFSGGLGFGTTKVCDGFGKVLVQLSGIPPLTTSFLLL